MRDCQNDGVRAAYRRRIGEVDSVKALRFFRVRFRIRNQRLYPVLVQFPYYVDHFRVSCVRTVFLECKSEYGDLCLLDRSARGDEVLDAVLRHVLAHVVIDTSAGKDYLAVVSEHLGFICQIIRVDSDAVPAYKARIELEEVPLCTGRFEYRLCVHTHFVEYYRQLVHERDVDVALAVFDDLSGLGYLYAFGPVYTRFDDQLVDLRDTVESFLVHAGYYLGDRLEPVDLVARVYPFRRVSDLEILSAFETGFLFEYRHADLFGNARIDRGLKHYHGSLFQVSAEYPRRSFYRLEVRRVVFVNRSRDCHDMEACLLKLCLIGRELHCRVFYGFIAGFICRVYAALIKLDFFLIEVVAYDVQFFCKRDGDRHSHVTEPYQGQLRFSADQLIIKIHYLLLPDYSTITFPALSLAGLLLS